MKAAIYWLATLGILAFFNWSVLQREGILRDGRPVYLKLAPVDPRSLMQGDYMVLRYEIARDLPEDAPRNGKLVLKLDEKGVGSFARVHTGGDLAAQEVLVRYKRGRFGAMLGAESFLFQEGHADRYEKAKYGELRVARDGTSVLTGLRGESLERLGQDVAADAASP
jgi:uncharacterized membrane-anchored protein